MNFIEEYPNAYPVEYCDTVIRRFEEMIESGQVQNQSSLLKNQDNRVVIDWAYHHEKYYNKDPDLCSFFFQNLNEIYSKEYFEKYKSLELCWQHTPKCMSIQRTDPHQGYHSWHFENSDISTSNRVLAYTLYLNDVEAGGETEFLYQGVKIKPEAGKLAIWPAGFTHPHRGNPIYQSRKYIVTGWFTFDH